jgi:Trk K+ transport system NAD-binding subunit
MAVVVRRPGARRTRRDSVPVVSRGHVIVCGLGRVGRRVVHLLRRLGEEVTVISMPTRDDWRRDAEEAGARIILGDARDERLVAEAGLADAAALVSVTDRDIANIEITLDAKRARPDLPVVTRLFDQTLARELESALDVRRAPAASAVAAPAFAAAALGDDVIGSFALGDRWWIVSRSALVSSVAVRLPISGGDPHYLVPRDAWIASLPAVPGARRKKSLGPLAFARALWRGAPPTLRAAGVVLLSLIAFSVLVFHFVMNLSLIDSLYFIVTTVTTVGYGDITPKDSGWFAKLYGCLVMLLGSATMALLTSLVTDYFVAARFRTALYGHEPPEKGHVVVVGVGNLGYRIIEELRRLGRQVVAVDLGLHDELLGGVREHHAVVRGDARRDEVLTEARISTASALIVATGDDAVNLGVALAARKRASSLRCVVRLYDHDFGAKVESGLGIAAARSASTIAAPTFAAAALYPGVRDAFVVGDELVALLQRDAPAEWDGKTAGDVSAILRRTSAGDFAPLPADALLAEGDHVLAVARRTLSS